MAALLEVEAVVSVPQPDGLQCVYAAEGSPLVSLYVRTPAEFEAERARFEDNGVVLPELTPVEGFEGRASVDPRYGSLNVTAGDEVVTVELTSPEAADEEAQLEREREIAGAALERL